MCELSCHYWLAIIFISVMFFADLCVKGAKCTGGKCYPVTKVFATTVVSSPSPTTAVGFKPTTVDIL